jgi:hypothetical protein
MAGAVAGTARSAQQRSGISSCAGWPMTAAEAAPATVISGIATVPECRNPWRRDCQRGCARCARSIVAYVHERHEARIASIAPTGRRSGFPRVVRATPHDVSGRGGHSDGSTVRRRSVELRVVDHGRARNPTSARPRLTPAIGLAAILARPSLDRRMKIELAAALSSIPRHTCGARERARRSGALVAAAQAGDLWRSLGAALNATRKATA